MELALLHLRGHGLPEPSVEPRKGLRALRRRLRCEARDTSLLLPQNSADMSRDQDYSFEGFARFVTTGRSKE